MEFHEVEVFRDTAGQGGDRRLFSSQHLFPRMAFDRRSGEAGHGDLILPHLLKDFHFALVHRPAFWRVLSRGRFSLHHFRGHSASAATPHSIELKTFLDCQRARENAEEINLLPPIPSLFPAILAADHPFDLARDLIAAIFVSRQDHGHVLKIGIAGIEAELGHRLIQGHSLEFDRRFVFLLAAVSDQRDNQKNSRWDSGFHGSSSAE